MDFRPQFARFYTIDFGFFISLRRTSSFKEINHVAYMIQGIISINFRLARGNAIYISCNHLKRSFLILNSFDRIEQIP